MKPETRRVISDLPPDRALACEADVDAIVGDLEPAIARAWIRGHAFADRQAAADADDATFRRDVRAVGLALKRRGLLDRVAIEHRDPVSGGMRCQTLIRLRRTDTDRTTAYRLPRETWGRLLGSEVKTLDDVFAALAGDGEDDR